MQAEKPPIKIAVGKATPEEIPLVLDIYRKRKADTWRVGCDNTYVARNAPGIVVGAVTFFETGPMTANIHSVGVDPAFEGKGVGKQLFKGVIEDLKNNGYRVIVVAYQNKNQWFYEKFGFKERNPSEMVLEL